MSSALGPRQTAILAAINAVLPTGTLAYAADKVPGTEGGPTGTIPARYVTVELSRTWNPKSTLGVSAPVSTFSVTTHYRAPNVTTVNAIRDAVAEALEDRPFDLPGGDTVGPFTFEFDGGIQFIAGGWSGFDSWTL